MIDIGGPNDGAKLGHLIIIVQGRIIIWQSGSWIFECAYIHVCIYLGIILCNFIMHLYMLPPFFIPFLPRF